MLPICLDMGDRMRLSICVALIKPIMQMAKTISLSVLMRGSVILGNHLKVINNLNGQVLDFFNSSYGTLSSSINRIFIQM